MTKSTTTATNDSCAKDTKVSNNHNKNNDIDSNADSVIEDVIDWKLSIIYKIVVFHCAFMLIWTTFSNFFPDHWEANMEGKGFLPHKLFSKYEGHPLVFATHITPAMFWVICIPIQFHPNTRKKYPKYHRYLGQAFLGTSCLMMIGVAIILKRKLSFEHYVNNSTITSENEKIKEEYSPFGIVKIPGMDFSVTDVTTGSIMLPFLFTAWNAVVSAKQKDYFQHQIWVIRHCSWGLWVVTQRILVGIVFLPICLRLYGRQGEFGPQGRYHLFLWSGVAGIAVSVGTAEYAVRLLHQKKNRQDQRRKLRISSERPSKANVKEITN